MRISSRIVINALANWAAIGVRFIIGFLLVPFFLTTLGRERYGLTTLVVTIVQFAAIADLGLRGAMGRHLSEEVAKKDVRGFNRIVSTGLVAYACMGTVLGSICFLLAPWLVQQFRVSEALSPEAIFVVRYYGSFAILIAFLQPVFTATITSNNRFDLLNLQSIFTGILNGVLFFLVLRSTPHNIYGWATVSFLSVCISFGLIVWQAYKIFPDLKIDVRTFQPAALRSLLSLGGYMYVIQLTNILGVQTDPIVIATFLGPAAVALYTPGGSLPMQIRPFVNTLVDQLHPVTTAFHIAGQRERLQSTLVRGTRYTLLMGIPFCVALGVFAIPIMRLWLEKSLGPDYMIPAKIMMCWCVINVFVFGAGTQWPVLLGMKRLRFQVWTHVPAGILNLVISIVLVGYTKLGVLGVMVATLLVQLIRRPIMIVYTAHVCGLSARAYFRGAYARPLLVLALLASAAWCLQTLVDPRSWLSLLACLAPVAGLWFLLCWWVGFEDEDRHAFRTLLVAGLRKAGINPQTNLLALFLRR